MKLIINADDCGRTKSVDEAIEKFINDDLITSSTIMANMCDFDGAKSLYEKYGKKISFGLHVNLTEGEPLTKSQVLLDEGFYSLNNGKVVFAGKGNAYCKLSKSGRKAVYNEMKAQLMRLLDNGINPSHIDSHQHIHFSRNIFPLFLKLGREFGIKKMRRSDNMYPFYSIQNEIFKHLWKNITFLLNPGCRSTDYFTSVERFLELYKEGKIDIHKSYELMCHPGHEDKDSRYGSELLQNGQMNDIMAKAEMLNYNVF